MESYYNLYTNTLKFWLLGEDDRTSRSFVYENENDDENSRLEESNMLWLCGDQLDSDVA